jgi:hypothetical protein
MPQPFAWRVVCGRYTHALFFAGASCDWGVLLTGQCVFWLGCLQVTVCRHPSMLFWYYAGRQILPAGFTTPYVCCHALFTLLASRVRR